MSRSRLLGTTESVCPECLQRIPAQRVRRGANIYLKKHCSVHGTFETVIWRGNPAYPAAVTRKPAPPEPPLTAVATGCPFDCGLCAEHRQQTCTALLEVTQRCDLQCAFCFAAAGRAEADPGPAMIEGWYRGLLRAGGPCNIQLSGGEPTLRDDLPEIIALGRRLGFPFIQLNTNGRRLARDPNYAAALKSAGLDSIFLQFDGLDDDIYRQIRGQPLLNEKLAALDRCADLGLGVVLVPTLVPGVNIQAIGDILQFTLDRLPTVRGVHFQPVSYFGRYPAAPEDAVRITLPEVIRALENQSGGWVRAEQLIPPGCEHVACSFHGNFIQLTDGQLMAWSRQRSCSCKPPSAAEGAVKARRFVAQHWSRRAAESTPASAGPGLGGWDELLERAKTHAFCISGMAFQDAWTLDLERLRDCCIHTVAPDGRIVPFCAYNLTSREGRSLYR